MLSLAAFSTVGPHSTTLSLPLFSTDQLTESETNAVSLCCLFYQPECMYSGVHFCTFLRVFGQIFSKRKNEKTEITV